MVAQIINRTNKVNKMINDGVVIIAPNEKPVKSVRYLYKRDKIVIYTEIDGCELSYIVPSSLFNNIFGHLFKESHE